MDNNSLASEYQRPSILEAGPWDTLPLKYVPRIEDHYFPGQLNLGIAFDEKDIRTFAEKHGIPLHDVFRLVVYRVAKYCTDQCAPPRQRRVEITTLARKGIFCLTLIDNYELDQCRPEELERTLWRLEDLWEEAGLTKQALWHTSATQATRKGIIESIDPHAVM